MRTSSRTQTPGAGPKSGGSRRSGATGFRPANFAFGTLGCLVALVLVLTARPIRAEVGKTHSSSNNTSFDSASRARSRAAFHRGVAQLRAQDWARARASFEEAWSLVQHPSILLNLGIARLKTNDPVLAEQDLVRFLSEDAMATAEELASARDALTEARSRIGMLRVIVSSSTARVTVDGHAVAVRALGNERVLADVKLKAGMHSVTVEATGFLPTRESVHVSPRRWTEKHFFLSADEPNVESRSSSSTRSVVGWSLLGLSGVAAATGTVMALRALSLSNDYGEPSSSSFQSEEVKSEGIMFRTGADVAFVTALAVGIGAIVLIATDLGTSKPSRVARRAQAPSLVRW